MKKSESRCFDRFLSIFFFSFFLALSVFVLSQDAQRALVDRVIFCGSLWMMFMGSARWWYKPIYFSNYNFFSPMALFQIPNLIYMGLGNVPIFLGGDRVHPPNPGASYYYALPIFSAAIGSYIFDASYRFISKLLNERGGRLQLTRMGGQIFETKEDTVVSCCYYLFSVFALVFMSLKYNHRGAGFSGTFGVLDNVLSQAAPSLFVTAWASVWLLIFGQNKRKNFGRYFGLVLLLPLFPILLSFFSRLLTVSLAGVMAVAYLLIHPHKFNKQLTLLTLLLASFGFVAITVVKSSLYHDPAVMGAANSQRSPFSVVRALFNSTKSTNSSDIVGYLKADSIYRIAGLEIAADFQRAHVERGLDYMWGRHNWVAFLQIIPRAFWLNKPTQDPRQLIFNEVNSRLKDEVFSVSGSAFCDGGLFGVVIALGFLGMILCFLQYLIWKQKGAAFVYLSSILFLVMGQEGYPASFSFLWFRYALLLFGLGFLIRFGVKVFEIGFRHARSG